LFIQEEGKLMNEIKNEIKNELKNELKNQYIDVKCKHQIWTVEKDNKLYAEGEERAPLVQFATQLAAEEGLSIRVFDSNDKLLMEFSPISLEEKLG
jgi:NADH dehydrogenase FAD-containing subunit